MDAGNDCMRTIVGWKEEREKKGNRKCIKGWSIAAFDSVSQLTATTRKRNQNILNRIHQSSIVRVSLYSPVSPQCKIDKAQSVNMKFSNIALLAVAPAAINAWTLTLGGNVWNGKGDRDCKASVTAKGKALDWANAWYSSCCLHLYNDAGCTNQVGYSCNDWKKTLSQPVKAVACI
ncbi:hypothetical protein BU24DRAFT_424579 [Aaosphaeria arxii CBS 175.79]|uniref:Uncharacterized protein n=1 Tax=Aaosphaeria arxii CBS 175.79 TaxID=1450172 RepID=A0A6A5XL52_9PLEO|nr:uncharacterized protein BU24DRAFT_424579 [Aaosphaeria arxii CBS 175.79]KAF2013579.1 hypothetical protein BU24DRAFT_424579 [Aaosphaeria arxii CBS 175.79]